MQNVARALRCRPLAVLALLDRGVRHGLDLGRRRDTDAAPHRPPGGTVHVVMKSLDFTPAAVDAQGRAAGHLDQRRQLRRTT